MLTEVIATDAAQSLEELLTESDELLCVPDEAPLLAPAGLLAPAA